MTELHPTPPPSMTSHKAAVAAVVAFLTSLLATLQGRTDLDTMTVLDWLVILVSAAIAGLTVWAVPNQIKGGRIR